MKSALVNGGAFSLNFFFSLLVETTLETQLLAGTRHYLHFAGTGRLISKNKVERRTDPRQKNKKKKKKKKEEKEK
jgi:hypothetical protein